MGGLRGAPLIAPPFSSPDYVYFENSSSNPYLVRRIEELNKVRSQLPGLGGSQSPVDVGVSPCHLLTFVPPPQTANGNVEAKVVCLFRRRDISSSLNSLADSNARECGGYKGGALCPLFPFPRAGGGLGGAGPNCTMWVS